MAKKIQNQKELPDASFHSLTKLIVWIAGVLVSLAVGFGMIDGTLSIWLLPSLITVIAGWIVVVLTLLGVVLEIIKKI